MGLESHFGLLCGDLSFGVEAAKCEVAGLGDVGLDGWVRDKVREWEEMGRI